MSFQTLQTVPIFRMFDVAKAREFYCDYLGFQIDWEHRFEPDMPLYMQISRGGCLLHLSEHHGDCSPGSTVFLRVQGLRAYQTELAAKNYKYLRPGIQEVPWGGHEMTLHDPFGNRLRMHDDTL